MKSFASSWAKNRGGSVIVLVLALVTLAGFLLSQFIERATTEMLVESRARQAGRLRVDAHSALEASLAVLADYQAVDGGLRAPVQGWGEPLTGVDLAPADGVTVSVQVEDESGRLSLPRLGVADLGALGRRLGLKETDATRLADALMTWTHREHVSTRSETDPRNYEYEDPPHRVPGRPLASFDELAAVAVARELFYTPEGRPTKLWQDFAASVSLHSFPAVNLNSARPEALALLAGFDDAQVDRIVAYNTGKTSRRPGIAPYFRSVEEARTLAGVAVPMGRFDTVARCLRIRVTVKEGPTALHLTAVVVPGGGLASASGEASSATPAASAEPDALGHPFELLSLEENIELAAAPTS